MEVVGELDQGIGLQQVQVGPLLGRASGAAGGCRLQALDGLEVVARGGEPVGLGGTDGPEQLVHRLRPGPGGKEVPPLVELREERPRGDFLLARTGLAEQADLLDPLPDRFLLGGRIRGECRGGDADEEREPERR